MPNGQHWTAPTQRRKPAMYAPSRTRNMYSTLLPPQVVYPGLLFWQIGHHTCGSHRCPSTILPSLVTSVLSSSSVLVRISNVFELLCLSSHAVSPNFPSCVRPHDVSMLKSCPPTQSILTWRTPSSWGWIRGSARSTHNTWHWNYGRFHSQYSKPTLMNK